MPKYFADYTLGIDVPDDASAQRWTQMIEREFLTIEDVETLRCSPLRAEPARIYADKDNLIQVVVNKDGEVMVWTRENQRAIWSPTILLEEKRS
jgi:hypothetical protein